MIECEQRRHERQRAKPGVRLEYRSIRKFPLLKGKYRALGTVVDMSAGGLAVEYRDRDLGPTDGVEYALSIARDGLRLEGLSMVAVSDFLVADACKPGSVACRRRGFRFGKLNSSQQNLLRRIHKDYTF